jgi:hypothetical protein
MEKKSLLSLLLAAALVCFAGVAFAQTVAPAERVERAVIINGHEVPGVMVIQNGVIQSYTCTSPQEYVAVDQSSQGWACYDQASGTWFLNALPQQSANVYEQTPVYDQEAPTVYGYYPSQYPYAYPYPYGYYPSPYYFGPGFALGFGFGHGFNGHGFHEFHGPHGHAFGPDGHGSFAHGSFGHGFDGGHMAGGHFGGGGGGMHGGGMHGGGMHGGGHR